jgi:hypothetical protein
VAALDALGGLTYWLGDQQAAQDAYRTALALRRELGDPAAIAEALYNLSFTNIFREEAPEGVAALDEAAAIFADIDDKPGLGKVLWARANLEWTTGGPARVTQARDYALRALEVFEQVGDRFMIAWSEYTASLADMLLGNRRDGTRRFSRALRLFRESGDVSGYTLVMDSASALLQDEGESQSAARLAGVVRTLERTTGTGLNAVNRTYYGYDPQALADDPATADAFLAGTRMSVDDAVGLALEHLDQLERRLPPDP